MKYDVVIIGAGPAGYVAAIRAGQLGLKVALIEKKYIGGMCINWGCIPTKALIESAKMFHHIKNGAEFGIDGIELEKLSFNWEKAKKRATKIVRKLTGGVSFLLKKNGIDVITGEAIIRDKNTVTVDNRAIETEHMIIATGSYPTKVEGTPDQVQIVELEHLFNLTELPQNIVVFGMGAITVEMAQFFKMIGKNVSIVTPSENMIPGADQFLLDYSKKLLQKLEIPVVLSNSIGECIDGMMKFENMELPCDVIINSSFRKGIVPNSNIEIALDQQGFITTNETFQTNIPNIYAVGDVNGKSYLAHMASAQGIFVINNIKGVKADFDFKNFPLNIYTYPEMAQIGMTEQQLIQEGIDYKLSDFPMSANGKALTEGNSEGTLRIYSDKKYGQVLGVQIVADHATDMIAEAAAYMSIEGTIYDVAQTIHAHPTISEIFMEAANEAVDKAIHK
jgi:dihydrolipoamide dehydrogenase